jgi:hypothetical protein
MLKRLVAGGLGLGVAAWAGIAGIDNTTRDEAGQITVQGELGAFVTQLGDCINDLPDATLISTVTGVPCDQPHHWQVFHKDEISLSEFALSEVTRKTEAICSVEVENLVNRYVDSADDEINQYENADISYLHPSAESWVEGDRSIDCLVGSYSEQYIGSLLD